MDEIVIAIKYLSRVSPIPPIIIFLTFRKTNNTVINLLSILLFISLGTEVINTVLSRQSISNIAVANSFFIIQLIIVTFVYYQIYLKGQPSVGYILIAFAIGLLCTNFLFWQPGYVFQNINWMISTMAIIVMSFGHFLFMARNPVVKITQYGPFWISTGMLFYCTFSFAIFAFSNLLVEVLKVEEFRIMWMFHNLNNIFKNGCFFVAIWWAARRNPVLDATLEYEN